ncbi:GntR family transcriptional regulator [Curtobacterium sp. NPDC089689]|uniref:GntR family transcriptional regulator n=1 Tax=Curtobacterium sp. NPDC089689 TaxID=3363968 RepID=UPI0038019C5E
MTSRQLRDDAAPTPVYLRIAEDIRVQIDAGDLQPGDALPPERELTAGYKVSRMTVRNALGVLEAEGRIFRDATRGTFVARPRLPLRVGSFSKEVERSGGSAGAEVVWVREDVAGAPEAQALGCDLGESVYVIQRLRRWDSEPVAVETTFYRRALIPDLLAGDLLGSLWDRLSERGITLDATAATVEVVTLDSNTAALLDARHGAPGLHMTRQTFDVSGRCVEYAHDVYRADRVALTIDRPLHDRGSG